MTSNKIDPQGMRKAQLGHICVLFAKYTFFYASRREKRLFFRQKKSTTFFHARISGSGKGRVSDFSATRVRVEGVGRISSLLCMYKSNSLVPKQKKSVVIL
jgi:hypothetical protein